MNLNPVNLMNPPPELAATYSISLVIPSDPAEARSIQEQIEQLLQKREAADHENAMHQL